MVCFGDRPTAPSRFSRAKYRLSYFFVTWRPPPPCPQPTTWTTSPRRRPQSSMARRMTSNCARRAPPSLAVSRARARAAADAVFPAAPTPSTLQIINSEEHNEAAGRVRQLQPRVPERLRPPVVQRCAHAATRTLLAARLRPHLRHDLSPHPRAQYFWGTRISSAWASSRWASFLSSSRFSTSP